VTHQEKRLIKETRWSKTYSLPDGSQLYESKFLFEDIPIRAEHFDEEWKEFSGDEKIDFTKAFASKRNLSVDDEKILALLMTLGPEDVWITIAPRLPSLQDKSHVARFLEDRIDHGLEAKANYYQALEILQGTESIGLLRLKYDEYRSKLLTAANTIHVTTAAWTDYLQCCKALFSLTGSSIYLEAIKEAESSAQPSVRNFAALLVREMS